MFKVSSIKKVKVNAERCFQYKNLHGKPQVFRLWDKSSLRRVPAHGLRFFFPRKQTLKWKPATQADGWQIFRQTAANRAGFYSVTKLLRFLFSCKPRQASLPAAFRALNCDAGLEPTAV